MDLVKSFALVAGCSWNVADPPDVLTTMTYDKENRMTEHIRGSVINTSVYDGTGHKRVEESGSARTTLIWDGDMYLGELA